MQNLHRIVEKVNRGNGSIELLDRDIQMLELKRRGMSYSQIARELGISKTTVGKRMKRILDAARDELKQSSQHLLVVEMMRLEALHEAWWPQAIGDGTPKDIEAAKLIIKISERRGKLMGWDTNTVELSGPNGGPIEVGKALIYVPSNGRGAEEASGPAA